MAKRLQQETVFIDSCTRWNVLPALRACKTLTVGTNFVQACCAKVMCAATWQNAWDTKVYIVRLKAYDALERH